MLRVAQAYDARTGFTSLIWFGDRFAPTRLAVLETIPVFTYESSDGFDGQFYAQIAVAGNPFAADVQRALDLPSYRARRILLPVAAHAVGAGPPARSAERLCAGESGLLAGAGLAARALVVSARQRARPAALGRNHVQRRDAAERVAQPDRRARPAARRCRHALPGSEPPVARRRRAGRGRPGARGERPRGGGSGTALARRRPAVGEDARPGRRVRRPCAGVVGGARRAFRDGRDHQPGRALRRLRYRPSPHSIDAAGGRPARRPARHLRRARVAGAGRLPGRPSAAGAALVAARDRFRAADDDHEPRPVGGSVLDGAAFRSCR